ncbi:MAG: hypothetical protein WCS87_09295 [Methylococcaceae bacterium]
MNASIQAHGCEALVWLKPKSCLTVIGTNHPWLWIPASMPE